MSQTIPFHEVDKFTCLERWLVANGSRFPKLELRDYGNEVRGCHSTDVVSPEETLIYVPLQCLITVEMGKETTIGRKILAAHLDLDAPKHIFLMIFMLIDMKNDSSFFKPYYDILPKKLDNMPIFWTENELEWLKGSYLLEQIKERNDAIENDYNEICGVAPEFREMASLEEFKWARMCVCSRNFGVIIKGLRTAVLVPYADMLNHFRPRETKWQYDDIVQGFTVTALQCIDAGDQVYDSYGQKCNHRFLLNYGFSVENNVEIDGFCPNECPILFVLPFSDPLYNLKMNLWNREGFFPSRRIRLCVWDNENTRLMFSLLRLIVADREDLEDIFTHALRLSSGTTNASDVHSISMLLTEINLSSRISYESLSSFHRAMLVVRSLRDTQYPISLSNERRAMHLLIKMVQESLQEYSSTLEEDFKSLSNSTDYPEFSNRRHALIQVKGEKEVLSFYLDLARTSLEVLQWIDDHEYSMDSVVDEKDGVKSKSSSASDASSSSSLLSASSNHNGIIANSFVSSYGMSHTGNLSSGQVHWMKEIDRCCLNKHSMMAVLLKSQLLELQKRNTKSTA